MEQLKNTDESILIGKNVIFGKAWLSFFDRRETLTKQQFENWRQKIDKLYDCYVELIGRLPLNTSKIFVDVKDFLENEVANTDFSANRICFNKSKVHLNVLFENLKVHDSWSKVMLREIAHIFVLNMPWTARSETMVNLLMSYAHETIGAKYGASHSYSRVWEKISGERHRMLEYEKACINYSNGSIQAFSAEGGSAYDLYLLGLIDIIGWDAYKKAFRSYYNCTFVPSKTFKGEKNKIIVRDFIERLLQFANRPDALQYLPDKALLLRKFFNAEISNT